MPLWAKNDLDSQREGSSMKYIIKCPNCNTELKVAIGRNRETLCEICACGFPENEKIYEWSVA